MSGVAEGFEDDAAQLLESTEKLATLAGQARTPEEIRLILQAVAQGLVGLTKVVLAEQQTMEDFLGMGNDLAEQLVAMQQTIRELQGLTGDDDDEGFEFFRRN